MHKIRLRIRHKMEESMEIQTIKQYRNRLAADKLRHIRNSDLVAAIDAFFEEMHEDAS